MYNEELVKKTEEEPEEEQTEQSGSLLNYKVILVDCLKGAKKFWYLLIIFLLIGASSMYLISKRNYVPRFKSSATFSISTLNRNGTTYGYSYNSSATSSLETAFPYIINSPIMTNMLKEELGVSVINGSYTAESIPSSNLFTITVTSSSAQDAYDILNAVLVCYPKLSAYVIGESELEFITQPEIPEKPYTNSSITKDTLIGAIGGAALWAALIALYAISRTTIRASEDIENKLGQECIAEIPFIKRRKNEANTLLAVDKKLSLFSEAYRTLRWRLLNLSQEKGYKVFAVTSTVDGEGKTTVAFNLAYSFASAGKKVALLDMDVKAKSVQKLLFPEEKDIKGLVEVSNGEISSVNAFRKYKHNNFHVYCAGEGDNLNFEECANIVADLKEVYDFILIDCPSGAGFSDTPRITGLADSVLYVVKQDLVTVRRIRDVMSVLFYSNSQIAGFIFNGVSADYKNYGGYYYGGYRYGSYKYGSYKYNSYRYGKYGYSGYSKYGKYGYGGYGYGYGYGYGDDKSADLEKDESLPDGSFDPVDAAPDKNGRQ